MKQYRNIIIIISIIIVIIIILLGALILINNNKEDVINSSSIEKEENIEDVKEIDTIKSFQIEKKIDDAINGLYDTIQDDEEDEEIIENDIFDKLDFYDGKYYIKDMRSYDLNSKYSIVFTSGDIIYNQTENSENEELTRKTMNYTIIEDSEENECYLEIYGENYTDIFNYSDDISEITSQEEKFQSFKPASNLSLNVGEYDELSDEDIVLMLYNKYNLYYRHFTKDAFEMLATDYRKERFGDSFEEYVEYLKEVYPIIYDANLTQYAKNKMNGYTLYTLVDSKNFSYFVKVPNNSVDIVYYLDVYTIPYSGYNDKYNSMSDSKKAADNMQKFINMINTKDYKHAYEVLDNDFKNANFGTLDEFKDYVRNNFYENNLVIDSEVFNSDRYYEGAISLSGNNIQNDGENTVYKKINIVMLLKEGNEFVMSFSME